MKSRHIALLGVLGLALSLDQQAPRSEPSAGLSEQEAPPRSQRRLSARSSAGDTLLLDSRRGVPPGTQQAYVAGQLMVLPSDSASLDDIARDHGASVVREAGPSGYGVLKVPAGDDGALQDRLRRDERVSAAVRHGLILGASSGGHSDSLQWHLESASVPSRLPDLSGFVVAVLDTGVAAVPSLADGATVAPWDFVNDDADASDDHQHGTHIASIIASNSDSVQGVAPGVSLMPLKVLNHENQGYELDLVDAIYRAVDSGADVINMSLAFSEDYVPSAALADALADAADAGVVLIGAAGNAGVGQVSWPAASPNVIAVGALCADDDATEYSNLGSAMDIMAPGGCIDQDVNEDGYPDGVIAESIGFQDPSSVGLWAMAGTSQAAAVVSGAAVHALNAGVAPEDMASLIQFASHGGGSGRFTDGQGAGALDIDHMVRQVNALNSNAWSAYHAAVLPYLEDNGDGTVTPAARVTVLNADLRAASRLTVLAQFQGATSDLQSCELRGRSTEGQCVIRGPAVSATDGDAAAALAWRITVNAVVKTNKIAYRPDVLMFGGYTLNAIAAAQNADAELREAMLALYWAEGDTADFGALAESYAVVNSGAGHSTSPTAMLFTAAALDGVLGEDQRLEGAGLSTSPLGMRWMMLNGSGLSASPISLLALTAFDGRNINTSITRSYAPLSGSGLSTSPILMSEGALDSDEPLSGLRELLDGGGWSTPDGEQAASLLAGSGEFSVLADAVGTGAGLGAAEITD